MIDNITPGVLHALTVWYWVDEQTACLSTWIIDVIVMLACICTVGKYSEVLDASISFWLPEHEMLARIARSA